MSRPRTVSNEQIIEAAAHVVAKNPAGWTLRDVGDQVGLSPATLVQRFGSKETLRARLLDYLNARDEKHAQMTGDLFVISCNSHRPTAGLIAFRMLALLEPLPALRKRAMGERV